MAGLGTTEIIIIALVIMVLFGAKRLPDAARSLGRSARILKAETKGLHDDDARPTTAAQAGTPQPLETSAAPPVARFDPVTGEPLAARFDPYTGRPLDSSAPGTPGATDRTP